MSFIAQISPEPVTGNEFVSAVRRATSDAVASLVEKALRHRGCVFEGVPLSTYNVEFGMQIALRESWRERWGEVATWDANARTAGVDPAPLEAAIK